MAAVTSRARTGAQHLMAALRLGVRLDRPRAVLAVAFAAALISACSSSASPRPPDPTAELRTAGQAMAALKSVTADVKFGPGMVYQGFTLDSATSKLQAPSSSDTTLKVRQGDFLVDVRVVTVNGRVFVKLPFGNFSEVSAQEAAQLPDMASLLDPQHGLPAVLPAGSDTKRVGTEKIGNVECDKITTNYSPAQVAQVLGGLQPAGPIAATLWISPSDHLVRRVLLNGPLIDTGKTTTVEVDLHDFNAPLNIVQPTP